MKKYTGEEYIIKLAEENNRMLKEIVDYIHGITYNADAENTHDFFRNILANLISTHFTGGR